MTMAVRDSARDHLAAARLYEEKEARIVHLDAIERFVPFVELVHRLAAHGIDRFAASNLGVRGEPALVMPVTEIHNGGGERGTGPLPFC